MFNEFTNKSVDLIASNRDSATLFIESVANDIELDAKLDSLMCESKFHKKKSAVKEAPQPSPQTMIPRKSACTRLKEMIQAIIDKISQFLQKVEEKFDMSIMTHNDVYLSQTGGDAFYAIEDQVYRDVENQVAETSRVIRAISQGTGVEPRKINSLIESKLTSDNVKKVAVNGAKVSIVYNNGIKKIHSYNKHLKESQRSLNNDLPAEDQATISKLIASANASINTVLAGTTSMMKGVTKRSKRK